MGVEFWLIFARSLCPDETRAANYPRVSFFSTFISIFINPWEIFFSSSISIEHNDFQFVCFVLFVFEVIFVVELSELSVASSTNH